MATEDQNIQVVESDVSFLPDTTGPAVIVLWRKAPVGAIQPLKRVPPLRHARDDAVRRVHREKYKPLVGKWHSAFCDIGYFDSKMDVAVALVAHMIGDPVKAEGSPVLQAAMRGDEAEVARLMDAYSRAVRSWLATPADAAE